MKLHKQERRNATNWLLSKGWTESGLWWLAPTGVGERYKAKCYTLQEAVRVEAKLRGVREGEVYLNRKMEDGWVFPTETTS